MARGPHPSPRCSDGPRSAARAGRRRGDPPELVRAVDRGVNRIDRPSAVGTSRGPPPGVTSLIIEAPGIRSCRAETFRPPVGVASDPSAAKSQMSLRMPAVPRYRLPSAATVRPSGSHVGVPKFDSGPAVIGRTARVATSTTWMSGRAAEVVVPAAVRGERDARAIGRPGRLVVADRAVGQTRRRTARGIDQPEVLDPVVREAGAVEHVVEPVDEPVVGWRRLSGSRLRVEPAPPAVLVAGGAVRARHDDQARAVGRPFEAAHAARQVREPTRLAAVERQQVDLLRVLALASRPSGRSGSSSTNVRRSERKASVRPSGEKRGCQSCRAPIVSCRGSPPSSSVGTSQRAWR